MAPAPANVAGSIDIPVRARLDTLERDLTAVRQRLERFDSTTGSTTRNLQRFEEASVGAADALSRQERELAATNARTAQLSQTNEQVTVSYRDLVQALSTVQSANDNVARSTRTATANSQNAS